MGVALYIRRECRAGRQTYGRKTERGRDGLGEGNRRFPRLYESCQTKLLSNNVYSVASMNIKFLNPGILSLRVL